MSSSCPCPDILWETEIKRSGFTNLAKKISKQPNVQDAVCVLLPTFSQIYSENQEQKADVKSIQFYQNGTAYKVRVMESKITEKIGNEKKPSTLLLFFSTIGKVV